MRTEVDNRWSLKRESDTSLSSPWNHWVYRQDRDSWTIRDRWRAAASFSIVSVSFSSSCVKFDFCIHPISEVLSPMDRRHDSGGMALSIMSTQIQTMLPRNSSRLMWDWLRRCTGMSHLQAHPNSDGPPSPCSQASERYTWVG